MWTVQKRDRPPPLPRGRAKTPLISLHPSCEIRKKGKRASSRVRLSIVRLPRRSSARQNRKSAASSRARLSPVGFRGISRDRHVIMKFVYERTCLLARVRRTMPGVFPVLARARRGRPDGRYCPRYPRTFAFSACPPFRFGSFSSSTSWRGGPSSRRIVPELITCG